MTGQCIITKLKNLKNIEGADKIQEANIFGETVIVSKDHQEGELGLLFDCETQLSHKFCKNNNLYRHSNFNKDTSKSGYIEDNRRIRPIKLKGVKCSGMWLPVDSLNAFIEDYEEDIFLEEGIQFNEFNGEEVCRKYVNPKTLQKQNKNQKGKARENITPLFKEHVDTDQAMRNLQHIDEGDIVVVTEKLHGTSARASNTLVIRNKPWYEKLLNKVIPTKDYYYDFAVGSRRVVKSVGDEQKSKPGFYDTDIWTKTAKDNFEGKLKKGESVYYEIVGYLPTGSPIMGQHSNSKLKKFMDKQEYKDFINRYEETTEFSYGCSRYVKFNDIYVYRISMTNEDGETIDLSWDQVKMRCQQLGVKHVPEVDKQIVGRWSKEGEEFLGMNYGEPLEDYFQELTESESNNFKEHIKEGVVVRVENGRMTPHFYKNKSFIFKCLEGIIKESDQVDIEESN